MSVIILSMAYESNQIFMLKNLLKIKADNFFSNFVAKLVTH